MRSRTGIGIFVVVALIATSLIITILQDLKTAEALRQVEALQVSVRAEQDTIAKLNEDVQELVKQVADRDAAIKELRKELDATGDELAATKDELAATSRALKEAEKRLDSKTVIKDFQVTWYNDSGTTKSGKQTQDGLTVAVDPKVIPLGTWIEVTMPDGTVMKRRADDTGSAVKGNIVDIYAKETNAELRKRGRTHGATVRILS